MYEEEGDVSSNVKEVTGQFPDAPIDSLRTLPARYYTDEAILDREKEQLLQVLGDGDPSLFQQASQLIAKLREQFD